MCWEFLGILGNEKTHEILLGIPRNSLAVFSLGFLEGQGGILTARSLEALIGKVIKISELKCVCLTYLYKGLASYS